jgi:hypothetical protein
MTLAGAHARKNGVTSLLYAAYASCSADKTSSAQADPALSSGFWSSSNSVPCIHRTAS